MPHLLPVAEEDEDPGGTARARVRNDRALTAPGGGVGAGRRTGDEGTRFVGKRDEGSGSRGGFSCERWVRGVREEHGGGEDAPRGDGDSAGVGGARWAASHRVLAN